MYVSIKLLLLLLLLLIVIIVRLLPHLSNLLASIKLTIIGIGLIKQPIPMMIPTSLHQDLRHILLLHLLLNLISILLLLANIVAHPYRLPQNIISSLIINTIHTFITQIIFYINLLRNITVRLLIFDGHHHRPIEIQVHGVLNVQEEFNHFIIEPIFSLGIMVTIYISD